MDLAFAARREGLLERAARECEALGAPRALAVPTDAWAFGGIDVGVNNAGMSLWGPFEAIPLQSQARLVEVNLLGAINGTHAVLPHFLARGGRGTIINMVSIGGRVPMPWAATYTGTEFGLAGFTEALRYELAARSAIEVRGVYPAFTDTPTNLHSANHTGRALRPVPPVVDPERVAARPGVRGSRPARNRTFSP